MYFTVLKELRDFSVDELKGLDSLLFLIYDNNYYTRFSPRVYKQFGLQIDEKTWLSLLTKLADMGLIQMNFELTCPYCGTTIEVYHRYDDIPANHANTCPNCGEEFTVSEKDIFITYRFTDALLSSCSDKSL